MTQGFFYYLVMAGLFQNFSLTTGFGASLMLRISERKKDRKKTGIIPGPCPPGSIHCHPAAGPGSAGAA